MTLSMYEALVPGAVRMLHNMSSILEKAAAHAESAGFDPEVLIDARLYPDMLPLARQVHIATDIAARGASRLAGDEPKGMPDTETTFADLNDRIGRTIKHLESFEPAQIEGSENRSIKFTIGGNDISMTGQQYLMNFVWPNVYFHITTAYDILRHNGVKLGKLDYLGGV